MKSKTEYENALKDSRFSIQLDYIPPNKSQEKKEERHRKRTIIWFNPPPHPLISERKD